MRFLILYVFIFWYSLSISNTHQDSIFKKLAFGKGAKVFYLGSGALKRYIDFGKIEKNIVEYSKTPAIVLGADICIYPYASNAYLGLGPIFTSWIGIREFTLDNTLYRETFSNSTVAIKLTHHNTYFVRNRFDLCSGYIVGLNMQYKHNVERNGNEEVNVSRREVFKPAFGITVTGRYYFLKNIGVYLEAGIGYKINMLNIGFCYKMRKI